MKPPAKDQTIADLVARFDEDAAELYSERAGIREFDSGTSRELAEALALADVLGRHPDALSDVVVFQVDVDDESRYFVSSSEELLREHAASLGGEIAVRRSIAWTVDEEFGGLAELTGAA